VINIGESFGYSRLKKVGYSKFKLSFEEFSANSWKVKIKSFSIWSSCQSFDYLKTLEKCQVDT